MNVVRKLLQNSDDSVVCDLTAQGRGAICVLALSGSSVVEALQQFFRPANGKPISDQPIQRPIYGRWNAEDIIVCRHHETYAEVHCHGGTFARQLIIDDLHKVGFSKADLSNPGFVSTTAEAAFLQLAKTTTRKTAAILTWQSEGALDRELAALEKLIAKDQRAEAQRRLEKLLERATLGTHLTEPWKIAIAGAANAGKSTLINEIVGFSRSIVLDQPGTTRDLVTVETAIDGWPVELIDTAGLRASSDQIEQQGIALAERAAQDADLLIEVVDMTSPQNRLISGESKQRIVVLNKCDLGDPPAELDGLRISALTGEGIEDLLHTISNSLVPHPPQLGEAIPFLSSQVQEISRRLESLADSPESDSHSNDDRRGP